MKRQESSSRLRTSITLAQREERLAYLLLGPPVLLIAGLILFPVAWNGWLAFHSVKLLSLRQTSWWELDATWDNFIQVFSHPDFWPALRTTLVYTLSSTLLTIALGLMAALLVHDRFPGRGVVRSFFLLPYVAPVVAIAFAWRFILDPRGILMTALINTGILDQPLNVLSQSPWAMFSLVAFEGWRFFPFGFLFIVARLQAIPDNLYEAAKIDGATPFQRFFYITLPQLKLVLATLFLLRFMWTFNEFDDVFLVTKGTGGTRVLTMKVYDFLIGEFNVGAGAAMALVLFAVLAALLTVYFRWYRRLEAEAD
ncbi:MAG: sugar ABC transporter permease [Leptolyngbyaceae cyanobacterium MO_188.B28]|nr:sugar ABC transporter permease [Leptolyngbyaceae cyanobacterium MO_188.B28]